MVPRSTHWTNRGATQPAARSRSLSIARDLGGTNVGVVHDCVPQTFCAFNFGVAQTMLQKFEDAAYLEQFEKLLQKFCIWDANYLFGCELGDKRKGVEQCRFDMKQIIADALPQSEWQSKGAYFSIHNMQFHCAAMVDSGVQILDEEKKVDLYWMLFTVDRREGRRTSLRVTDSVTGQPVCGLAVGIFHITVPSKGPKVTIAGRPKFLKAALNFMASKRAWCWPEHLPIARLLVGDVNMTLSEAEKAIPDTMGPTHCAPFQQRHGLNKWQLEGSIWGGSGDFYAFMGCTVENHVVPVGLHYPERGMRNDQHDAVGGTLYIPYRVAEARPQDGGAPQPASSGIRTPPKQPTPSRATIPKQWAQQYEGTSAPASSNSTEARPQDGGAPQPASSGSRTPPKQPTPIRATIPKHWAQQYEGTSAPASSNSAYPTPGEAWHSFELTERLRHAKASPAGYYVAAASVAKYQSPPKPMPKRPPPVLPAAPPQPKPRPQPAAPAQPKQQAPWPFAKPAMPAGHLPQPMEVDDSTSSPFDDAGLALRLLEDVGGAAQPAQSDISESEAETELPLDEEVFGIDAVAQSVYRDIRTAEKTTAHVRLNAELGKLIFQKKTDGGWPPDHICCDSRRNT